MPLKTRLLVLTLFLMMAFSGFVNGAYASISDFVPPWYDPYWDKLGSDLQKEGWWSLADLVPFVPTQQIRTVYEHGLPKTWPWGYDPFWDDLGTAMIHDNIKLLGNTAGIAVNYESGSTVFSNIANYPYDIPGPIDSTRILNVPGLGMVKDTKDIAKGINTVISAGKKVQQGVSEIEKMKQAAKLAQQGIGTPQLSPSTDTSGFSAQNKDGTDVPETSGVSYFNQANDVWYIDAYGWHWTDKSLYKRPAAPLHFVSGELNTYGYNWIYLPFEQTGMTHGPDYDEWVEEYLASIGSSGTSAGYGFLVDEGVSGGDGW